MLFASSKDALRRSLVGIAVEIQGTDFSEVAYESGAYLLLFPTCQKYHIFWFPCTPANVTLSLTVLDKASRGA